MRMIVMIVLPALSLLLVACCEPVNYMGEVKNTDFIPGENYSEADEKPIAELISAASLYGVEDGTIYKETAIDDSIIYILRSSGLSLKYYGIKDSRLIQFSQCNRCGKFLAGDMPYCKSCKVIVEKERAERKEKEDDDWGIHPNPAKPWSWDNPIGF